MTHSTNKIPQQAPPPGLDPIITTTPTAASSYSSTLSVSPSPSVLLPVSNRKNSTSISTSKSSFSTSAAAATAPPLPPPMTSSTTRNSKLEQIIQNFYSKTTQIIIQSRISHDKLKNGRRKMNKWFNITTNDYENLKQELKFWKSLIKYPPTPEEQQLPPMMIDIYLENTEPVTELLQSKQRRILIESWSLSLNHPLPDFPVDLPNLYKRCIVFFRSLHSLVRLLPSYNIYRRTRHEGCDISLGYTISSSSCCYSTVSIDQLVSFDRPLSSTDITTRKYEFKSVVTPLGAFQLDLIYRENDQFDTQLPAPTPAPALAGQGSMDDVVEEYFFTPKMTKYRQREEEEEQSSSSKQKPLATVQPMVSPSSSSSTIRRLQSYRSNIIPSSSSSSSSSATATTTSRPPLTPLHPRYPTTSISSTTSLERRISAPFVSPFKSPSLSSSPQAELMSTSSHSQTTSENVQQLPAPAVAKRSDSFGRKIEFSSSFEKFKSSTSSSTSSSTKSINRTSSISVTATTAGVAVPADMMRRWSRTSDHCSLHMESEEDEEDLEEFMKFIGARQELKLFQQHSIYATEAATVTPGMTQQGDGAVLDDNEQQDSKKKSLSHFRNIQETHTILSDSMSFSIHPTAAAVIAGEKEVEEKQQADSLSSIQQQHSYDDISSSSSLTKRLNLPVIPSPLQKHNIEPLLMIHPTINTKSAHHQYHRRHNSDDASTALPSSSSSSSNETLQFFSYPRGQPHLMTHQVQQEIMTQSSPLKNRQAAPLPFCTPTIGRSGSNEDDDSLMFKMSELSAATYEEEGVVDYLGQRFQKGINRIQSSEHVPMLLQQQKGNQIRGDDEEEGSF